GSATPAMDASSISTGSIFPVPGVGGKSLRRWRKTIPSAPSQSARRNATLPPACPILPVIIWASIGLRASRCWHCAQAQHEDVTTLILSLSKDELGEGAPNAGSIDPFDFG